MAMAVFCCREERLCVCVRTKLTSGSWMLLLNYCDLGSKSVMALFFVCLVYYTDLHEFGVIFRFSEPNILSQVLLKLISLSFKI